MIRDYIKDFEFYDGVRAPKTLSASSVSRDILELYLAATETPKKGVFSKAEIGSIFHLGMEAMFKSHPSVIDTTWVQEKRYHRDIMDYQINGKIDLVDFYGMRIIDWKTMSASRYKHFRRNDKYDSINIQLAIYNWIIGGGYDCEAHCFITDWDPVKPAHPASAYQVVKCDIMTLAETEEYIKSKITALEKALASTKYPAKCENVLPRYVKDGVYIDSKCAFYCNYAHVCKRKSEKDALGMGLKWG